jgi:hypothetical protein
MGRNERKWAPPLPFYCSLNMFCRFPSTKNQWPEFPIILKKDAIIAGIAPWFTRKAPHFKTTLPARCLRPHIRNTCIPNMSQAYFFSPIFSPPLKHPHNRPRALDPVARFACSICGGPTLEMGMPRDPSPFRGRSTSQRLGGWGCTNKRLHGKKKGQFTHALLDDSCCCTPTLPSP